MTVDEIVDRITIQKAAGPHCRLIRASEDLLSTWGTRTEDGRRITVEWGEPDKWGVYEPVFTVHDEEAA